MQVQVVGGRGCSAGGSNAAAAAGAVPRGALATAPPAPNPIRSQTARDSFSALTAAKKVSWACFGNRPKLAANVAEAAELSRSTASSDNSNFMFAVVKRVEEGRILLGRTQGAHTKLPWYCNKYCWARPDQTSLHTDL